MKRVHLSRPKGCLLALILGAAVNALSSGGFFGAVTAAETDWGTYQTIGRRGTPMNYLVIGDVQGNGALTVVCKRSGDAFEYMIAIIHTGLPNATVFEVSMQFDGQDGSRKFWMDGEGASIFFGDVPQGFPQRFLFAPPWVETEIAMSLWDAKKILVSIETYPRRRYSLEFIGKNQLDLQFFLSMCVPELEDRFDGVLKSVLADNREPGETTGDVTGEVPSSEATEKAIELPWEFGSFAAAVKGYWDGTYTCSGPPMYVSILRLNAEPPDKIHAFLSRCAVPRGSNGASPVSLADDYELSGRFTLKTGSMRLSPTGTRTRIETPEIELLLKPNSTGTMLDGKIVGKACSSGSRVTLQKRPERGADPCMEAYAATNGQRGQDLPTQEQLDNIDEGLADVREKIARIFEINTGGNFNSCPENKKAKVIEVTLKFAEASQYVSSELGAMFSLPNLILYGLTGGAGAALRSVGAKAAGEIVDWIEDGRSLLGSYVPSTERGLELVKVSSVHRRYYYQEMQRLCPNAGVTDPLLLFGK